jgi:hypothetical protein
VFDLIDWFADLFRWVGAVLKAWYGWLPSSAIAALVGYLQVLEVWHPSRRTYVLILATGVGVSLFEAWRIEHKRAGSVMPDFNVEIEGAVSSYEENAKATTVYLGARIINRGAQSAITSYKVRYHCIHYDTECQLMHLSNKIVKLKMPNGQYWVMDPKDAIGRRTEQVIPKGGFLAGRLIFSVPGNRCDAITEGHASLTLTVKDYLGKEYSKEFFGTGKGAPSYMTGEPVAVEALAEDLGRKNKQHHRRQR